MTDDSSENVERLAILVIGVGEAKFLGILKSILCRGAAITEAMLEI